MKNKLVFAVFGLVALVFVACDMENNDDDGSKDLKSSIQVNNQLSPNSNRQLSAARSVDAEDKVELYIHHFEYMEDAHHRALIIIANGDRDMGSKGGILTNAGWYSVKSDLGVTNDFNNGPYSSFLLGISKLRVNGTEYDFPPIDGDGVVFGHWSDIWVKSHSGINYPDNFDGIKITDSVYSLKTVLTVEPGILDEDGNLVDDPYKHIKVEGRINE